MGSIATSKGTQHVAHMRVDKDGNVMGNPEPYNVKTNLISFKGEGTVDEGCYSVMVRNVGKKDGYVLGCPLRAGDEINFQAPDKYGYLPGLTFDASGTVFIVQYIRVTSWYNKAQCDD